MPKNKGKSFSQIEYLIDNEPASLWEVIESVADDTLCKEYMEKHNLQDSDTARRFLKQKLGDFLSAKEISKRTAITAKVLDKWRNNGLLKADHFKGSWYYSLKSILDAIKTADIKDLKK